MFARDVVSIHPFVLPQDFYQPVAGLARIDLTEGRDPNPHIDEALDLATAPERKYAWGEADAAHAWGLAFEALGQREHAQRAFTQALAVRERIEHPQAQVTLAALARVADN